jgi:ATP synthase F1 complex assembly factor 1
LVAGTDCGLALRVGAKDISDLKQIYEDKIAELKKATKVDDILSIGQKPLTSSVTSTPTSASRSPFPPPPPAPKPVSSKAAPIPSSPGIKTLNSYIALDKIRELPAKEIEAIWRLRHVNNPQSLCAVIPLEVYKTVEASAKKYPQFILPLPHKENGAEIHFLQWTFPAPDTVTVMFTHLAEYKLRGEFAEPHTTITHHLELAKDKDVVLLQGQVISGRGVSVDQAQFLLVCLQKFYGAAGETGERRKLMDQFIRGDTAFKVETLMEEAEKIV